MLQVLHALATEEPAPPAELNPELPQALAGLLSRLLAKDPAGRPASAREVAEALAAVERGEPSPTPAPASPAGRGPGNGPSRARAPSLRKVIPAGLLVAAAAAWLFGPTLLRFARGRGELIVETDRDVMVVLSRQGQRVQMLHADGPRSFEVPAGDYDVEVVEAPAGTPVNRRQVRLASGGQAVVSVPKRPPAAGLVLPATFRGVGTPAYGVAFSPDGRLLAAVGAWKAKVWDVRTGQEGVLLEEDKAPLMSVAFSPDGRELVCGGLYSLARLWDLPGGKLRFQKHLTGEVRGLAYAPDGKRLVSASIVWSTGGPTNARGAVAAWDPSTGAYEFFFDTEAELVPLSVACSPDGKQVAAGLMRWDPARRSATGGGVVRVWEVGSRKPVHDLPGPAGEVRSVAYSHDGKHLRCSGFDGAVWGWDAGTGRPLPPLRWPHGKALRAIAFGPAGRRLAGGAMDGLVCVWDYHRGEPLFTLGGHRGGVQALAFSPDGRLLASAGDDGLVKVWDAGRPPAERRAP